MDQKIQLDTFNTSLVSALTKATTPEEAAKLFSKLATAAIGQAVADALGQIVNQVKATSAPNPTIDGWTDHIVGVSLNCTWPTPGFLPISTLPPAYYLPKTGVGDVSTADVGFSIVVNGSF